jgi:putative PIN family toxin of toxin-antitoxin system
VLRAVLDANAFVSAAIHPGGPPGQIVDRFLRKAAFEIVLSPAIAEEVMRALSYPKVKKLIRSAIRSELWFEDILMLADFTAETLVIPRLCDDPDDDKYVAAAIEGNASFVVTGDKQLLAVVEHEVVRILTPRAFLGLLDI